MNITNNSQQSFGLRFYRTEGFQNIVKYAEKTGKLSELDAALNKLLHINGGDILIIHGKTPTGKVYSSFNLNRRSVQNMTLGVNNPEETSFNSILELAEFGKKLKSLLGVREIKTTVTSEDIFNRYSKILPNK